MAPLRRAANAPCYWKDDVQPFDQNPRKVEKSQAALGSTELGAEPVSHSDLALSTVCFYANSRFIKAGRRGRTASSRQAATQMRGKQNGDGAEKRWRETSVIPQDVCICDNTSCRPTAGM